ncbi:hypothetical protein NXX40_20590 [Parabacteroides distasonis]|nr:hypothetical protein [Parabacteroides distasonis]
MTINACNLGVDDAPIIGNNITQVGERIGQFYGLVWEGVYKNKEEFDKYPKHAQADVGTIRFKDVNGDGKVTQGDDRDIIGNPGPFMDSRHDKLVHLQEFRFVNCRIRRFWF